MPRKRNAKPPSYCCHKASGRAVVRINGRDRYLGEYGSPESHAEYERLIAEWRANQQPLEEEGTSARHASSPALTISQMLLRYREFARDYYSKEGAATKEFVEMRYALRPVRLLYGGTLAREFGPLKLKAVRQHMVDAQKLSRGVVNNRVNRIRRAFRWAVSEELIPPSVIHGLNSVEGLRRGRTSAPEPPPVEPVPDVWGDAVLPFLSPARECGAYDVFEGLRSELAKHFDSFDVTKSTITFYGKIPSVKSGAAILALVPGESNAENGLLVRFVLTRVCDYTGIDAETIVNALPSGFTPSKLWSETYHIGHVESLEAFEPFVRLLARAR